VARGLTRPLGQLVRWARRLGEGDLSLPVPASGRDEIGFLGRTLEQMRRTLEARDREQRAMVAGVAHEIRNPLGGIRLYAELLESDAELGPAAREKLRKILRELEHLGSIVDEFLLFARPAAPSPQPVDAGVLATELLEWLQPQAERAQVRLECAVEAGGPVRVRADPTQLRQILHNLVVNAIDASPAGGVVRVRLEPLTRGVRLAVEDDGPGIDAAQRERLFEPFYTTKPSGAGLGLPIVRRLALLNGAQVELERASSGGARFVLRFEEEG